ncbi:MAG: hypothetical protein VW600_07180, partial [Ferrovibrio sp.]
FRFRLFQGRGSMAQSDIRSRHGIHIYLPVAAARPNHTDGWVALYREWWCPAESDLTVLAAIF